MIRKVANCPYCRQCRITVDDAVPSLKLGEPAGRVCPHLVFASVGLQVEEMADGGELGEERTGIWLWAFGEGLRRFRQHELLDPLLTYVDHLTCNLLDDPEDRPQAVRYRVVGGTAGDREARRPGSGEFRVRGNPGQRLVGILDGWAIFARDARAVNAEVRRLAGTPSPVYGSLE